MIEIDKKEFIIGIVFWFVVIFLIVSLLSGCVKTAPVTNTVADSAKTTISTIIQNKPECKDVGDACNSQIDVVKASCEQEMKIQTHDSWKRGLKQGGIFASFCLIIGYLMIKRLFK